MSLTFLSLKSGCRLASHHAVAGEQKVLVLLHKNGQKAIYKTFTAGEIKPTHYANVAVLVAARAGQLIITQQHIPTEVTVGDYIIPNGAPQ
jgi:hypothetical protein